MQHPIKHANEPKSKNNILALLIQNRPTLSVVQHSSFWTFFFFFLNCLLNSHIQWDKFSSPNLTTPDWDGGCIILRLTNVQMLPDCVCLEQSASGGALHHCCRLQPHWSCCCASVVDLLVRFLVISPTLHLSGKIPAAENTRKYKILMWIMHVMAATSPGFHFPSW